MKIKMTLLLLLVMLCYGYGYFVQECMNKYEDYEKKRLCIDAKYWEILFNKMQDKLNECYQDC